MNRKPGELPTGWRTVQLRDVAAQCLGKMLDGKKNRGQPLPYLRNPNVRWFDVDLSDLREMPFEDHELERYGLRDGDVLVCEGGEAGRAAIWDGCVPTMKFQKAIHRLRPGPDLLNRFLVHQLKADYQNGRLADYYTGATIKHLTGQDLARYTFALPPLAEQRRIAGVLDRADVLRAKRRAAIAKLDALTSAIFMEMFGDAASNPKGWPIVELRNLLESVSYGTSRKASTVGKWPILRMNNVTYAGDLDLRSLKYIDLPSADEQKHTVRKGDLLFNRTNSRELVGKTAVFKASTPMAFAGYLIRLRPNSRSVPEYLGALLNSSWAKRQFRSMAKSIIGMANINAKEIGALKVMQPSFSLQQQFAARVEALDALKARYNVSLGELDALFASLQHRAFRGEL